MTKKNQKYYSFIGELNYTFHPLTFLWLLFPILDSDREQKYNNVFYFAFLTIVWLILEVPELEQFER